MEECQASGEAFRENIQSFKHDFFFFLFYWSFHLKTWLNPDSFPKHLSLYGICLGIKAAQALKKKYDSEY
jgi:hypothetical protein